jgi:hypothetical protein
MLEEKAVLLSFKYLLYKTKKLEAENLFKPDATDRARDLRIWL